MNKAGIIGIVVSGIIIGILAGLSLDSFSLLNDNEKESPVLGNEEEEDVNDAKPQGRNLSLELDEKMGLSAP